MLKHIISPGDRFGRLVIIKQVQPKHGKTRRFLCQCACGNMCEVDVNHLVSGKVVACGCYRLERIKAALTLHGDTNTSLYHVWQTMKARCKNAASSSAKYYHNRGISVCDEWRQAYVVFKNWALANGYKPGLSIDRIDTDGNYTPDNCRWVDCKQQCFTRRRDVKARQRDKRSMALNTLAILSGISKWHVQKLLHKGFGEVGVFAVTLCYFGRSVFGVNKKSVAYE